MVAGMDGTKKNHTIMMPCSVNSRLYSSEVMNQPVGLISSSSHETDGDAADEEENGNRQGVEDGDALVVRGREPRGKSMTFLEIAFAAALERRHKGQRRVGHRDTFSRSSILSVVSDLM